MSARPVRARHRFVLSVLVALVLAACLSGAALGAAPPADTGARATTQNPVDINTADVKTLESVPGIGPALAKRIVDFRAEHGSFRRVDDLLKIRGIGEKSLDKLRPFLTVGKRG